MPSGLARRGLRPYLARDGGVGSEKSIKGSCFMCCLITTMLFAGPRVAIILWWLVSMERWESAFDSFIVPFLGFIFLP